jgi:hypothetical protein
MGTAFFSDLVNRFGGVHLALASYNAGEHRVARWMAERPGLDRDEWIDDIPFPETQGYVKKILGTADDYRRLYGGAGGEVPDSPALLKTLAPRPAAARSLNAHVMTSRAAVHASKSKSKRAVQAAKHRRNPKSPHGKPRRTHKP